MKSEAIQRILHKVALNNGITDREAKRIVAASFKFFYMFANHTGSKRNNYDYKSVLLPFFGKFAPNERTLKKARDNMAENIKNEEDEG
jgi:nucleoid DNA-binding protein